MQATKDDLLGANLFTYCANCPVMYSDPSGFLEKWQELGFKYNGTMADLRRFENGLPPLAYDMWLINNSANAMWSGTVYSKSSTDNNRLSPKEQVENALYIYEYLSKKGWSKAAICGLLGNIQQECW